MVYKRQLSVYVEGEYWARKIKSMVLNPSNASD